MMRNAKNSKPGSPIILTTNDRFRKSLSDLNIKPLDITDYFPGLLNFDMICKGSILNLL